MKKVAAIQMCSTSNIDENLTQAHLLLEQAAASGAVLAVLPEMFPKIGQIPHDINLYKESYGHGKIQDCLAEIALKHRIWIVGGTIPIQADHPNKIKAACIVFDDQGQQMARYDKMHLFDAVLSNQESYVESDTTEAGTQVIVVPTPVGTLGLGVCFDIRFPSLFSELSALGAEVIAIPAAFTVQTGQAHWETLMRCRALDCFSYMIGAGQGGTHSNGRITHGHSMIVNPWGEILDEVKHPGTGIAYGDIDLQMLYDVRKRIPVV
ncbi:MAG: hypothetical protein CK424_08920 [Legionella sp.]|nr:MAG: hypothetical protein CK424_08920 [Legionella sp.]